MKPWGVCFVIYFWFNLFIALQFNTRITQIQKIQDLQRRKSKSTETLPTGIAFRAIS